MRPEWHARQQQVLEARIERARLPELWTLETFPYSQQPGVNRRQIRAFAELHFIRKAENIVFVGKSGVGKTGLACSILVKALENGYRGQFVRAQDLFHEMYASLADRSSRKLLTVRMAQALPKERRYHRDSKEHKPQSKTPNWTEPLRASMSLATLFYRTMLVPTIKDSAWAMEWIIWTAAGVRTPCSIDVSC